MNFRRLWAIFTARNHEFFRDRSAFGWNFLFPFLIIAGFGIIFGDKAQNQYKVGVFPVETEQIVTGNTGIPEPFRQTRYIEFIGFPNLDTALEKLKHHKIDFLIRAQSPTHQYWVSDSSPKGYVVEKLFKASLAPPTGKETGERLEIHGTEIRYLDWLFPGILGMNMMFSALWGVGFIVVRYRKNGVLKRLHATPLTALEYLSAQMLSRIFILAFTLAVVWVGCDLLFSFTVQGSYLHLALVYFTGGLSLCSLGLLLASRGTSEEFTSGVVNFICWPMMFLSEVWFSLEGAPEWVRIFSKIFPLTHLISAARKVMNDGASLAQISGELTILVVAAAIFLSLGAWLFSWND